MSCCYGHCLLVTAVCTHLTNNMAAEHPRPRGSTGATRLSMEPLPASFYGAIHRKNPVVAAFEAELKEVLGFLKRLQQREPLQAPPGDHQQQQQQHDAHRRGASTLFNIWTKYNNRLPASFYQEKLLKVGDALIQIKEYKLALLQCYGRYLQQFTSANIDDIADATEFKSTFFPNGMDDANAVPMLRALQGRSICIYEIVRANDSNLCNQESVKKLLSVLSFLRLIMQVVLPYEHLCWLIYNGAVHIYNICRCLMSAGHSAKALEYLLWASVCMESSVPLLAMHYLTWRTTLYTAVCQCYFDCKAGVHGEVFARRALCMIDELSLLESMTDTPDYEEAKKAFTEATTKMAVMIFKRAVYESRRKPKGYLRPKLKSTLKDSDKMPWPRTPTERLLVEMFEHTSTHFLAILEALSGSNIRLIPASPAHEEPEMHDVNSELLYAGMDILLGGGSNPGHGNVRGDPSKVINSSMTLLQLAVEGRDGVSAEAAVKFTKLAFSYEQWDVFDAVIPSVINFVQSKDGTTWRQVAMDLKVLLAIEPLLSGRKPKHGIDIQESYFKEEENSGGSLIFQGESIKTGGSSDDIVILAETLFLCVCDPAQIVRPDKDLIVDVIMFLWQKCKPAVQRIQPSSNDGSKFLQKFQANSKWVHILLLLQEIMLSCDKVEVDIVIIAEVALRLAAILENSADSATKCWIKSDKIIQPTDSTSPVPTQNHSMSLLLKKSQTEHLHLAYEVLEKAIHGMAVSRSLNAFQDVSSVIDYYCTKGFQLDAEDQHEKIAGSEHPNPTKAFSKQSYLTDLHLELIYTQHGVSAKLLYLLHGDSKRTTPCSSACAKGNISCLHFFTEQYLLNKISKNKMSKAIFLMQKAAQAIKKGLTQTSATHLSEEVLALIQKAEAEERAMYTSCIKPPESVNIEKSVVPPPPILISRTDCSMIFKPASFTSDVKVSWYCLFGRQITGEAGGKARMNDHHFPCTGEEIPASGENILEVKGLKANEKYVFAVAAYSADGNLIGDGIGKSTKPILAYPPLSTLMCLAYLTQAAYQCNNFKVAKKAFSVLWNYYVSSPMRQSIEVSVGTTYDLLNFTKKRLSYEAVSHASPFLLQLFLRGIFIVSDISVKEGGLFCDILCVNGALYKWQVKRIKECEKPLIALELCNWLNDVNHALQAVVQIYGLLVPIIYHKIPSKPVIQILIKALVEIQEIHSSTWQKKQSAYHDSVLHMIACIAYYLAQILRSWDEYELTKAVIDCGKRLLDTSDSASNIASLQNKVPSIEESETVIEEKTDTLQTDSPKKNVKKPPSVIAEKINEQLAALEANLLKMTKTYSGGVLTGHEDPILLHAVVTSWPSKTAFRELLKFKNQVRFLEFFVQLLQREVYEEKFQQVLDWTVTVLDHLSRRNAFLLGIKKNLGKQMGEVTVTGEAYKRYTAALVEYRKNRGLESPKQTRKETLSAKEKEKEKKLKQPRIPADKCVDPASNFRKSREDVEKRAFSTLVVLLTPIVAQHMKRSRFHQICIEEMPWRSQLNLLLACGHFSLFQKTLSQMPIEIYDPSQRRKSDGALNPEIFSLHNSGAVVIGPETKPLNENALFSYQLDNSLQSNVKRGSKSPRDSDRPSQKSSRSTPRTQRTNETEILSSRSTKEQDKQNVLDHNLFDHYFKIFLHLKRAVVLAHRGGHWTLLHNACRVLWNFTLELQSIVEIIDSDQRDMFPITIDMLNYSIWLPFYLASDASFDMIIALEKNNSIQVLEPAGQFSVPSCVGSITDESGGSSLTFEYPLDDVNAVDLRVICDIVLRTIEVLYHLKRWESLVYIAIQFNIISHERYSEKVTPLLVYAQRQLINRIQQFRGPHAPQPHFTKYASKHGEKINCRNFMGKQLEVATKSKDVISPGGHIDPAGHNIYSDGKRAKALVCVPLDVNDTLKCLRETLRKSKYPSRALRHSRKLLSLFLSHVHGSYSIGSRGGYCTVPGKVGFSVADALTQQPVPPDLSDEDFVSPISIQSKDLPLTQLSMVILSYEKTIEILHGHNQQDLKAQALHELGNLHIYAKHRRAALQCWCQALDEILKADEVLKTWQSLGGASDSTTKSTADGSPKDYSEAFLQRAGIWGCLQAAVVATKISQYILRSDLIIRTECCILSAFLFKALFRASLPHPRADGDYALYEIGEHCDLVPGIDLFSDRYRADIATVVASLDFLMYELHRYHQNLMVLPLCTLYQYLVSTICHDPVKSVEGRILKIKVLTDLRFFSEAYYEINQLNDGIKIPKYHYEGNRPYTEVKEPEKFDASKPLLTNDNTAALYEILNKSPSPYLTSVCDQHMMNTFLLAKMHFIACISSTFDATPEKVEKSSNFMINKNAIKHSIRTSKDPTIGTAETTDILQLLSIGELTVAKLKAILLSAAERSLTGIIKEIQDENSISAAEYSASDLEVVDEAQRLLVDIAQQRYQTALIE